jgi:conjugal transfer mating pair stabilization protein TraN
VTNVAAGTQPRSCLRYQGVGNYSCARSLTVSTERTTSCTPGDWFAHAASGRAGLDAQCLPDRPETAQHFRITQDGAPLAFFDVNMTTPVVFPEIVAVEYQLFGRLAWPIRISVWAADKSRQRHLQPDRDIAASARPHRMVTKPPHASNRS